MDNRRIKAAVAAMKDLINIYEQEGFTKQIALTEAMQRVKDDAERALQSEKRNDHETHYS